MYIAKLAVQNFKGRTFAHELSPVTLVAAGNFRSKTAIPLAIRLAMAGYLPAPLGVRSVYELAGNPEGQGQMAIKLTFDTGREQAWKWTRNAEGSISVDGGIASDIAMPELMLDPKLFWAKTHTEQIKTIFNVCQLDQDVFSPETILKRLGEVQVSPVAYCESALQAVQARIAQDKMTNIQDWMERILNWLKSQEKTSKDLAKSASGAFKAFKATQSNGIPTDVTNDLNNARQELQIFEQELSKANVNGLNSQLESIRGKLAGFVSEEEYTKRLAELQEISAKHSADDEPEEQLQDLAATIGSNQNSLEKAAHAIMHYKAEATTLKAAECCPKCQNDRKDWKRKSMAAIEACLAAALDIQERATAVLAKAEPEAVSLRAWISAQKELPRIQAKSDALRDLKAKEQALVIAIKNIQQPGSETLALVAGIRSRIESLEAKKLDWEIYQKDRERKEALEAQVLEGQAHAEVFKTVAGIVSEEQQKLIESSFKQVLNVAQHFTTGLINSPLEFIDGELGRRVSQADIEMGCIAPVGSWIAFKTFSGTEELLALAGFGVALTGDAPVKLVILDEMGRLEEKRRVDIALRMLSLVESGIIDQAILIDVDPRGYAGLKSRAAFKIITP